MNVAFNALFMGLLLHGWWLVFGVVPMALFAGTRARSSLALVLAAAVLITACLVVSALTAWWQWPLDHRTQRTVFVCVLVGPFAIGLVAAEAIRRNRGAR